MESILTSIKKLLGITEEYTHFDQDIIMHINMVFSVLYNMGIGTDYPFTIEDSSTTWNEFIDASPSDKEMIRTYMYLRVKQVFDPPQSSITMESTKNLINELEWRLYAISNRYLPED